MLNKHLSDIVQKFDFDKISKERKSTLQTLVDYINKKRATSGNLNFNFICTHNSRRSQLAQIWAATAAHYFNIKANCYSGGIEVTSFNERAVESLKRFGFTVSSTDGENPIYSVHFSEKSEPIIAFSKLFDNQLNPSDNFAAIMTCSHADENCPFIPGTEKRISIQYEDPKKFDGTSEEKEKYDERSLQIGTEMIYVFSKLIK